MGFYFITGYRNQKFSEQIRCCLCGEIATWHLPNDQNGGKYYCSACKDGLPETDQDYICPFELTGETSTTYIINSLPKALNVNEVQYTLNTHKSRRVICHMRSLSNKPLDTQFGVPVFDETKEVVVTFEDFVKHAYEDSTGFILAETEDHIIVIVTQKRGKTTTCTFLKRDEGYLSSWDNEGDPNKTRNEKAVLAQKRQKKSKT